MTSFRQCVMESAQFLKSQIPDLAPDVGFLTGTGLSDALRDMEVIQAWSYTDLPHFPVSTVASHKGQLAYGRLGGKTVLVFQGRFHLYEGYSPQQAAFPVRLLQELTVPCLILSNAAGGINLNFSPGDIMVIEDHINLTGCNPLLGPEVPEWGLRFPDMTRVYDTALRQKAMGAAASIGLDLQHGVYAGAARAQPGNTGRDAIFEDRRGGCRGFFYGDGGHCRGSGRHEDPGTFPDHEYQ